MLTTTDVLDQHLKSFGRNDLDGVLADYSTDAVLFIPGRSLKGPNAIKPFFQALLAEFAKPGASFSMQQCVDGDYAYILWSAETADNSYEAATDTFVVRNGKIVAQSFAARITPKHKHHHPSDLIEVFDEGWDIGAPVTVDAIRALFASE
jgi:ketosteroid isomerase-like protein